MIFDGKAFAREIEDRVAAKVSEMVNKPKIVSVMVGGDPAHSTSSGQASVLYTRLKSEAAKRVGIEFEIYKIGEQLTANSLQQEIAEIAGREDVTGIMVQLPIPGLQGLALKEVLSAIPIEKDVDGLRWEESHIKPATVRAVLSIVDKIAVDKHKFVVLGARGAVGRPLVHFLKERGVSVSEVEWDTPEPFDLVAQGEVVISCTGKAGLVTHEMVKEGAIVIDVGSPKGEMTREVYQKASVSVEVPGGVGPVTIACLMESAGEL